jgi:hypothetical protein
VLYVILKTLLVSLSRKKTVVEEKPMAEVS